MCISLWGVQPWIPTGRHLGHTARVGPAHKIEAYGAWHWSACNARQQEEILVMKEDLIRYARYCIPYKYLSCNRLDIDLTDL
jgi:hypothetical protein